MRFGTVKKNPKTKTNKTEQTPFRFLKSYCLTGDEILNIHYLPELEWVLEKEKSGDGRNRENSQTSSVWSICVSFVEK